MKHKMETPQESVDQLEMMLESAESQIRSNVRRAESGDKCGCDNPECPGNNLDEVLRLAKVSEAALYIPYPPKVIRELIAMEAKLHEVTHVPVMADATLIPKQSEEGRLQRYYELIGDHRPGVWPAVHEGPPLHVGRGRRGAALQQREGEGQRVGLDPRQQDAGR